MGLFIAGLQYFDNRTFLVRLRRKKWPNKRINFSVPKSSSSGSQNVQLGIEGDWHHLRVNQASFCCICCIFWRESYMFYTLKWKFLISLESQLYHMIFCWGRHVKGCFAKADTGESMFCWSTHLREQLMFRNNINMTPQTVGGSSCIGHLTFSCWCSLV